jgi:uncharacterized protein (DUF2236 family)
VRQNRSIAWQVNAERLALLGWSRAILLQLAHPLVAAGVADHSTFRAGTMAPVRRLHATVKAMLSLTFGGPDEQRSAISGIRRIHARVKGQLSDQVGPYAVGTTYSAEDPALILWVHATLLDSIPLAFEQLVRPLAPEERDAYCEQTAWVAVELGARTLDVPRSWAALQDYLDVMEASGVIVVSPAAKTLADAVLASPLPFIGEPAAMVNRLLTKGWLPPRLRAAYGWTWDASSARQVQRVSRVIRQIRRVTPDRLARWRGART